MNKMTKENQTDPAIAAKLWELCQETYEFGAPWTKDQLKNDLAQPYSQYFLLQLNEVLAGFVSVTGIPPVLEITNLAVKKEFWGQNCGKKLLTQLVQAVRKAEVKEILLEARTSNKAAIQLYREFGFKELGVRKNYYHEPKEDALIMKLEVD